MATKTITLEEAILVALGKMEKAGLEAVWAPGEGGRLGGGSLYAEVLPQVSNASVFKVARAINELADTGELTIRLSEMNIAGPPIICLMTK